MLTFKYSSQQEQKIVNDWKDKDQGWPYYKSLIEEMKIPVPRKFADAIANKAVKDWGELENNFLEKLGDWYEYKLVMPKEITCYLSRYPRCPYNFKGNTPWFAAPLFGNPMGRIKTVMHELTHYFQPKKLPFSVKEAIPVILNDYETFKNYWRDRGHDDPVEQEWRKKIWELYKEGGKFSDLLKLVKGSPAPHIQIQSLEGYQEGRQDLEGPFFLLYSLRQTFSHLGQKYSSKSISSLIATARSIFSRSTNSSPTSLFRSVPLTLPIP